LLRFGVAFLYFEGDAMLQILKVNDTVLQTPANVKWALQDISSSNSGRTLDGVMHKDRIAQKVKLSCSWPAMPFSDASTLLRNVNSQVTFNLTYFDVMQNGIRTARFYVGDRTAAYLWVWDDDGYVKDVSFDFIEV